MNGLIVKACASSSKGRNGRFGREKRPCCADCRRRAPVPWPTCHPSFTAFRPPQQPCCAQRCWSAGGTLAGPRADNSPATGQKKARAVHHWDVLAGDVAGRVAEKNRILARGR